MTQQFTFPSGPHINEIPLWINFSAIQYSKVKTRVQRNRTPAQAAGEATVTASVPFNGSFTNSNSLQYTNEATFILSLMGLPETTNTENIRLNGLAQMLDKDASTGMMRLMESPTTENPNSANIYMSVDMMDMMFVGGGNRGYIIDFNLVCRSPRDSLNAGELCSVLSSQCWPLLNTGGLANGNAKLEHPDIWAITLSEKPGDFGSSRKFDHSWNDGIGPQLCVLTDVKTKRVGGENSRILGINRNPPTSRQTDGAGDSSPLPLWYQVSLSFVELEPAIQDRNNYYVINRSSAFGGTPS